MPTRFGFDESGRIPVWPRAPLQFPSGPGAILQERQFIDGAFGRPKIRCLIVDGHALVRHGMRRLLEDEPDIEVVEEAGNANEALQKLGLLQPDVVLMDTGMPGLSSPEVVRLVQHTSPRTKLIFLTAHGDNQSALHGLQAGAMGY